MGRRLSDALDFASASDPGMVRSHNEDSVFVNPKLGLAILADGMGGQNAGEVASAMATTLLSNDLDQALKGRPPGDRVGTSPEPRVFGVLREQIVAVNGSIFHAAESQPQYAGMGTTVVIALFYDNRLAVAHLGDSRLYRLRGARFGQVTKDHSLVQLQVDSGLITAEQARRSEQKHVVTRALGIEKQADPEIHEYDVRPGDIYLLCSDGLSDMVDDKDIVLTLQTLGGNLKAAAGQLVQQANDNGGKDNVSVVLVRVLGNFATPKTWWQKLLAWFR